MATKTYTTLPPNFLASEVGLLVRTAQFSAEGVSANENGRKIIAGGTIYPSNDANVKGIVFEDVDVTDAPRMGALIVAGRIFENRLPVTINSNAKTALQAKGMYFDTATGITR